ncbi:MAG: amylo-alpha-1,6-glucosidase [Isosphaeraceae bacterium]
MTNLIRSIENPCQSTDDNAAPGDAERVREWIVTNGLGGYASGTVCGVPTRRYHGLLIAALPAPLGRTMMLNQLHEQVVLADGRTIALEGEALAGRPEHPSEGRVSEFRLESGLPVWRFELGGVALEKRLLIPHLQNTVYVSYRLLGASESAAIQLRLRPLVQIRPQDASVSTPDPGSYRFTAWGDRYEIASRPEMPTLQMTLLGRGPAFTLDAARTEEILFRLEAQRGYDSQGEQWSPGFFHFAMDGEESVALVASVEGWETLLAMSFEEALRAERRRRSRLLTVARRLTRGATNAGISGSSGTDAGFHAELVLAADQFLIQPAGRVEEAARAHAAGDEVRTVIAGYHWFTDWGRDTMIALEGLTLATGRTDEASYILRTFAHYVRDGLIPNMFPEGQTGGLYHTADASLWFFHAVHRYVEATHDRETLSALLPRLAQIADRHIEGTRFGIGVDPLDGLLRQGAEGYQLTWMDAKVDDCVVTPRRGKAVEINALWYNALRLLEGWMRAARGADVADRYARHADRARQSFNKRFWYADGGYLYDVVDGENGDDSACRPNQLFAFSLDHEVLDRSRWQQVLDVVRDRLVTPFGLRSLAPGHPDYKPCYFGNLRARDAAYHQGTVWPWLIGPFVDAWLKVRPKDRAGARQFLEGFRQHLNEGALGTISEIFDAEPPFIARGCIAQAWSVAEVLRAWLKATDTSS